MHLHRPFLLITLLNHAGLGPTALCLESSVSPASHIVPRTCHACQFLRDCSHTPLCLEVTFNDLYFFLPIQLHTLSMYSSSASSQNLLLFQLVGLLCFQISYDTNFLVCTRHWTNYPKWTACLFRTGTMISSSLIESHKVSFVGILSQYL